MSRCFPFPPPGYEKRPRSEDVDLLKEEKRKEKKHRKEKKDKEKGEGKEKREKDRSDGKHREKKDRKDKHKDKKEKDRDKKRDKENKSKDKEKNSVSKEAKAVGHPGASSTEPDKKNEHYKNIISLEEKKHTVQLQVQHGQKAIQGSNHAGEVEESKFVQELGRRIRDEENGKGIQLAGRFSVEWKRDERMDRVGVKVASTLDEDKGTNMERSVDNKKMDVQATRNESRFSGNAIAPNITGASKSKIEGMPRAVVKDSGNLAENKEMYMEKSFDSRKMDAHATRNDSRFSANAIVPNITGFSKSKVEGMPRPLEEENERKEEKEKTKERGDEKLGDKKKDKDGDKKRHKKDKDQEKKKKKEKSKEKSEHKKSDQDRLRDINKNDFTAVSSNKTSELSRDSNAGTAFDVNLKKRKFVTNGSLYENETGPAKVPRPSSHKLTQNGNKVETLQVPLLNSNRQEGTSEVKVVNKERRINGAIHGQPLSVPRPKPLLLTAVAGQIAEVSNKPPQADQIAEASRKPPRAIQIAEASRKPPRAIQIAEASRKFPADQIAEASKKAPYPELIVEASKKSPHPDSKYLSQILTVPKLEEWIECDDQEWLFGSKNHSDRKPGEGSNGVNEELEVWCEARYVESTDIYALPYVIPY